MGEKNVKRTAFIVAVIFSGILIISVLFMIVQTNSKDGQKVAIVYQEGKETMRLSLLEEKTYEIDSNDGGYNILEVKDECIRVIDADCPDKLCCKMKCSSSESLPIVCLPHKLVVTVTELNENADEGIDAVVY